MRLNGWEEDNASCFTSPCQPVWIVVRSLTEADDCCFTGAYVRCCDNTSDCFVISTVCQWCSLTSRRQHQCSRNRALERKSLLLKEQSNKLKSRDLLSSCYSSLIGSLRISSITCVIENLVFLIVSVFRLCFKVCGLLV
jgi:hypothetical protein